jgi:hypothetical protein
LGGGAAAKLGGRQYAYSRLRRRPETDEREVAFLRFWVLGAGLWGGRVQGSGVRVQGWGAPAHSGRPMVSVGGALRAATSRRYTSARRNGQRSGRGGQRSGQSPPPKRSGTAKPLVSVGGALRAATSRRYARALSAECPATRRRTGPWVLCGGSLVGGRWAFAWSTLLSTSSTLLSIWSAGRW